MSKDIKIIECEQCHRELYRKESGQMLNKNGVWGMNIQHYTVSADHCPKCSGVIPNA